jgi:tRNA-2-methylthio-N6-dimethylallyladenosine synthase
MVVPVLVEKPGRHQGQVVGRSPWLQSVHLHAPGAAIGETIDVRLLRLGPNSIAGEAAAQASGEAA